MRLTGKLQIIEIDNAKLTKALDEKIKIEIRQGLRAFLDAAIKKVPVLTGMARGGYIPLARYLGRSGVTTPGAKPKPSRNKDKGADLAEIDDSELKFPDYTIKYNIDIIHFNIHDPDNWRSVAAGRKALEKYFDKNLVKQLPKLRDFTTRTTVEFGNG